MVALCSRYYPAMLGTVAAVLVLSSLVTSVVSAARVTRAAIADLLRAE